MRNIRLPSGKVIELFEFEDLTRVFTSEVFPDPPAAKGMHVCVDCDSKLVYPTDWEETDGEDWYVELRCPNCEWSDGGVFGQDILDEFDEELNRSIDELTEDLGRLARANMAEAVDSFIAALNADAIFPSDF